MRIVFAIGCPNRRPPTSRSGSILIVVVVIIMLITYVCYQFVAAATDEHRTVAALAEHVQLELCADSAEEYLAAVLAQPAAAAEASEIGTDDTNNGGTFGAPEKFVNIAVTGDEATSAAMTARAAGDVGRPTARQGKFTVIGWKIDDQQRIQLHYGLANESSRLSLDAVARWEEVNPGTGRQALVQLPGIDLELADDIVQLLGQGRGASLDDLLLVARLSKEQLYGKDRNRNYHTSSAEASLDDRRPTDFNQAAAAPLYWYLTPYSAERNVSRSGQPRIYLNNTDLADLGNQLESRLPQPWTDFIIAYRTFGPAEGSPAPVTGSNSASSTTERTAVTHKIHSVYDLIGAQVNVGGPNEDEQILESPFSSDPSAMRQYLRKLVDEVTVDWRPVIPGRVNINTAPPAVLRAIPGADSELVQRIVSARSRDARSPAALGHHHASWLLVEGWVDVDWMRELEPYITARGDVYRGQVVGFYEAPVAEHPAVARPRGRAEQFVRREIVVDVASASPRVIYRQDLTDLGRGFAVDVLTGS